MNIAVLSQGLLSRIVGLGFLPLTGVQKGGGSRGREKGRGTSPPPLPACLCPFLRLLRRLPLLKIPILELLDVSQVNRLR